MGDRPGVGRFIGRADRAPAIGIGVGLRIDIGRVRFEQEPVGQNGGGRAGWPRRFWDRVREPEKENRTLKGRSRGIISGGPE